MIRNKIFLNSDINDSKGAPTDSSSDKKVDETLSYVPGASPEHLASEVNFSAEKTKNTESAGEASSTAPKYEAPKLPDVTVPESPDTDAPKNVVDATTKDAQSVFVPRVPPNADKTTKQADEKEANFIKRIIKSYINPAHDNK
jgi:hypothetical protein